MSGTETSDSPCGPIIIAGGSGFLGVSMAMHLAALGRPIVVLSRRPPKPIGPWRHVPWDARSLGEWRHELNGASGLINLVGRSVDCIKTPAHQDEILRSRVEATRVLGWAVRSIDSPPPVWVQMSTAHIYGDPPEVTCTEDSPFGYGLAPFVGRAWEDEFQASVLPSQRRVILRTSFVIGRDRGAGNGALGRLGWLAQIGLGGTVGSGTQGMSWIHEADFNRLFERANSLPTSPPNSTNPLMEKLTIAHSRLTMENVRFYSYVNKENHDHETSKRVYVNRAAGGDRHHRSSNRTAVASSPASA